MEENEERPEVFALLVAIQPSPDELEVDFGAKGTKTTWQGTDKDD